MDTPSFRRLIDTIKNVMYGPPVLDELIFTDGSGGAQSLQEGKWIPTKSGGSIRIDPANYGAGRTHAHVYGRKGNELGVVNIDGTSSHGTKMQLHFKDAEALLAKGFAIRPDRMVEWLIDGTLSRELLLG